MACDISSELTRSEKYDMVFTCGPAIMMAGIVNIFKELETPVEVSLENYFGCGIGLCSGCAVETTTGIKKACVDGPVFTGQIIKWDLLL